MLDTKDLEILIILQEKPTANDSTLARLVNLSSPTIKRRLDRLYDNKIIERIQGILNYKALELIIVSVFLETPSGNEAIIQERLQNNPYIYYQVRCVGASNGYHATFRIPADGVSALNQFFQSLKDKNLIKNYTYYIHQHEEIRTRPRFLVYNSIENSWDFDFTKWANVSPEKLQRGVEEPIKNKPEMRLQDLDKIDIEILSILSLNSRIKNVDILENLSSPVSPQRLSDRLRHLRKSFVADYRILLSNPIFDFVRLLYDCKADENDIKFIKSLLSFNPPPFQTIFRETDHGFLLYLNCPLKQVFSATDVFLSHTRSLRLYILNTESAVRYTLNSNKYIPKSKSWEISMD